jgi:hypothetical protein
MRKALALGIAPKSRREDRLLGRQPSDTVECSRPIHRKVPCSVRMPGFGRSSRVSVEQRLPHQSRNFGRTNLRPYWSIGRVNANHFARDPHAPTAFPIAPSSSFSNSTFPLAMDRRELFLVARPYGNHGRNAYCRRAGRTATTKGG